jgi:hypothetical protein
MSLAMVWGAGGPDATLGAAPGDGAEEVVAWLTGVLGAGVLTVRLGDRFGFCCGACTLTVGKMLVSVFESVVSLEGVSPVCGVWAVATCWSSDMPTMPSAHLRHGRTKTPVAKLGIRACAADIAGARGHCVAAALVEC